MSKALKQIIFPSLFIISLICVLPVAFQLLIYHFQLIFNPYPLEYREGVILLTTDLILKGENPYSFAHQPSAVNMYGIFYNWLILPLAKFLGPTAWLHRFYSAVFIIGSCGLLAWILKKEKVSWGLWPGALLIFYATLIFPVTTTACAGPHSLGLFLFLLSIVIAKFTDYSYKGLFLSLIVGILGFYSKPYAILAVPVLAAYLFLFVSKKKSILFGFTFLILFSLSVFIMSKCFECYFGNVFFINQMLAENSIAHMKGQFGTFFKLHQSVIWAALAALVFNAILKFKEGMGRLSWKPALEFDKPLFNFKFDLYAFFFICMFAALYLKLGRHTGSWMAYYFHLLSPFVLILIFRALNRNEWVRLMALPFIIANVWLLAQNHHKNMAQGKDDWYKVKILVDTHKNILNSPIITQFLVEENKPVYDNGHSEYFKLGAYRTGPLGRKLVPPDKRFILGQYEYLSKIRDDVRSQKFDLVMLTYNYAPFAPQELTQYYELVAKIPIVMPHFNQYWNLTVWAPKQQ